MCVCEIEWNHMTRRHRHYISLTTGFKAFPKNRSLMCLPHLPRTALDMNADVLWPVAECWVGIFDFEGCGNIPRTFPLKMVQSEAIVSHLPNWIAFMTGNYHAPSHITIPCLARWQSSGRSCSKMISLEMAQPRPRCMLTVGGFENLSPMRCATCVKIGHPGHHGCT